MKNYICNTFNEAAISSNVGFTTFGPPSITRPTSVEPRYTVDFIYSGFDINHGFDLPWILIAVDLIYHGFDLPWV
jgi:hypothetical protein